MYHREHLFGIVYYVQSGIHKAFFLRINIKHDGLCIGHFEAAFKAVLDVACE